MGIALSHDYMSLDIPKICFSCFFLIKSVGNGAIDHHMFAGRDQDKFNYHLGLVGMWGTHICGTRPEEKSVAICGPY